MIKVSKDKWDSIPGDCKGVSNYGKNKGRKIVLSGWISEEKNMLLIENIHFKIIYNRKR